jgi:hypothetical protein
MMGLVHPLGFYFLKKFIEDSRVLRSRDPCALGPTPSPRIQAHPYTQWVSTLSPVGSVNPLGLRGQDAPDSPSGSVHPVGQCTQWVIGLHPVGQGIPRSHDPLGQKGLDSVNL